MPRRALQRMRGISRGRRARRFLLRRRCDVAARLGFLHGQPEAAFALPPQAADGYHVFGLVNYDAILFNANSPSRWNLYLRSLHAATIAATCCASASACVDGGCRRCRWRRGRLPWRCRGRLLPRKDRRGCVHREHDEDEDSEGHDERRYGQRQCVQECFPHADDMPPASKRAAPSTQYAPRCAGQRLFRLSRR